MFDLVQALVRGGLVMVPLLICSLLALTIAIERVFWLWRLRRRRDDATLRSVFIHAENGQFDQALSEAQNSRDPLLVMIAAGLRERSHGMVEGMQVAAQDAINQTRRGLGVLDTIITLAPLLGILGTVLGIIESFGLLGEAGIDDPRAVTGGIAQALITTAAGLAIAVVALIPFNYFISRVENLARRLERVAVQFELACRKGHAPDMDVEDVAGRLELEARRLREAQA